MYQLKRDGDNCVIVYNFAGEQVLKLEGGYEPLITMTYLNMSQYEHRGDDYMSGVIQGCIHMMMLAPDAFSCLPPIPPFEAKD